jgi:hypothetical protein
MAGLLELEHLDSRAPFLPSNAPDSISSHCYF